MAHASDEKLDTQIGNGSLVILASSSSSPSKPPITISILSALPSDAPTLSVVDMLTFTNDPITAHMYPLRLGLINAGKKDPRKWPDYGFIVFKRWIGIRRGLISLKATVQADGVGEREEIVGFASMSPPERLLHPIEDVGDVSGLVVRKSQNSTSDTRNMQRVGRIKHGVDAIFYEKFFEEFTRARVEIMGEKEHYVLNHFFVTPTHQRLSIGSSLMMRCVQIAEEAKLPIMLVSTRVGVTFYERHGFEIVRRCKLEYMGDVFEWPVMVRDGREEDWLVNWV